MAEATDTPKPNPSLKPRSDSGKKTEPWKPASVLSLTFQENGYRYRFGKPERHERKLQERWQPVERNAKDAPKILENTIVDGTPLHSYAAVRGLILYKMHEDDAKAREEYYHKQTNVALDQEVKDYEDKNSRKDDKVVTFGNIRVGKKE